MRLRAKCFSEPRKICAGSIGRTGVVDPRDPRLKTVLEERASKGRVKAELNCVRKDSSVFPADCTSAIFKNDENEIRTVIHYPRRERV